MTEDYEEGVQYLDVEKGDKINQDENDIWFPSDLFKSIDLDSGMSWLSHLGVLRTDVSIYLYSLSSRNFSASLHLFL